MPPVSMALACLHFFVAVFHPASPTACVFVSFVVVPHTHTHLVIVIDCQSRHCYMRMWIRMRMRMRIRMRMCLVEVVVVCLVFFSLFFCCLFFFCLAIVAVAYIDIVVKSFKVFIFFSLSPFSQHFAVLSLFCRFHFLFLEQFFVQFIEIKWSRIKKFPVVRFFHWNSHCARHTVRSRMLPHMCGILSCFFFHNSLIFF